MKKLFLFISLLLVFTAPGSATVKIDGTAAQQTKIANWLTQSLGATVGVDAAGNLTIGAGGNAAATRLRNMINDAANAVTIKVVVDDQQVTYGAWQSSTADPKGPTTGTQRIDIADIENIGNIRTAFGFTPDVVLMHEITEVYEGKKDGLNYEPAHAKGTTAENEVLTANGATWEFRFKSEGGFTYRKLKLADGSFIVIRVKPGSNPLDLEWFREKVPCTFESAKLIAIPDPDPKVHLFTYNYDLNHVYAGSIDTANSRPTGAAFDSALNLYITEDLLTGPDEIRVFNRQGVLVKTITDPELVDPQGIDIDKATGEIFAAVKNKVLRFAANGNLLGTYSVAGSNFMPTDVAIWRNNPAEEIYGDGKLYELFVTDKGTSQVYRFSVQNNMNTGAYGNVFGREMLVLPEGIYVDEDWTVWVASTGNNRVYCFTPDGNPESFTANPYFIENTSMKIMDMIKVRGDGVYVLDGNTGRGKLVLYDLAANPVKIYGLELMQCPASVAVAFATNMDNLIPMKDPGGSEAAKSKAMSPLIFAAIGLAVLLIGFLVYRKFATAKR